MSKSIAICGAGPGLGQAVARRYATDGYEVVLVARRQEPLEQFARELTGVGAIAHVVAADLSDPDGIPALADQVRASVGDLDALYYGPTPGGTRRPATDGLLSPSELTPQDVQAFMPLALYSLVALAGQFLPAMVEGGEGAILAAGGASAVQGMPPFAAPGPALAAQRNYLQSLGSELADTRVYVGRLYIAAPIKGSAWHTSMQADTTTDRPAQAQRPAADPVDLAELLWTMHHTTKHPETLYPQPAPAR